jgi:putative lipoprotein
MLDRIAEFFLFGFAPMVVVMLAAPEQSWADTQSVKGEIVYRERIALPPNALVTVQLADVSLADAPAAIVAEQKITPKGPVPIPFELNFDSSAVRKQNSYALQARITVDNKLMFINDEHHAIDPIAAKPQTGGGRCLDVRPDLVAAVHRRDRRGRFEGHLPCRGGRQGDGAGALQPLLRQRDGQGNRDRHRQARGDDDGLRAEADEAGDGVLRCA